jgi:hypothetical protein
VPSRAAGSRPWYKKARYAVPPLAMAVTAAAVVVAMSVQDTDTQSGGRETGGANVQTSPGATSDPFDLPYDEAYGRFEPITVSDSGRRTIPLPAEAWNGGIVTATYAGSGRFDISTRWDSSKTHVGWISHMDIVYGPYSGTVTYGTGFDRSVKSLDVGSGGTHDSADGEPWQVTIAQVSSAKRLPPVVSGSGDAVFLYSGAGADVVLEYRGLMRFLAFQALLRRGGARVLVPSSGAHSGTRTVHLAPGPSIVEIHTDGWWQATIK